MPRRDGRPVWKAGAVIASLLAAGLALSACAGGGGAPAGAYVGGTVGLECAPFARALTGVRLSGDAADWWPQAQGRYARAATPSPGSVLVLKREDRLPHGHVAVVSKVLSSREILVTQANWVHHRVSEDQPVVDVSILNNWSVVRMFWPPSGQMGSHEYPAYGFIRPERPLSHDEIAASTPRAIRVATGD